jgi:predicted RNA-binding protein with PIN domain
MGFAVTVVFDAMRNPRPVTEVGRTDMQTKGGVRIVYARASADAWIRERMQSHAEPALVTVVTSDREILASATAAGCASMRVTEFLQLDAGRKKKARDLRDSEKPQHQSKRQLAEWERLFGNRPDDEDA